MDMAKFFKWTVEFEVHADWVADGFVMTDDRALEMLASDLGWANMSTELRARVIKHPNLDSVAREQGYKDAKHMLRANPQLMTALLSGDDKPSAIAKAEGA
jgi:hypothetical protein